MTEQGVPLAKASRDLDINQNMLRRWRQELEQHGEKAFPGNGVPIEEELARLRKEVEVLRRWKCCGGGSAAAVEVLRRWKCCGGSERFKKKR